MNRKTLAAKAADPAAPHAQGSPGEAVELTIRQRDVRAVPGLKNVRIRLGDITEGRVLLSVSTATGEALLEPTAVRQGDSVEICLGGKTYGIRVVELANASVGEDFATLRISPAAARPGASPRQADLQDDLPAGHFRLKVRTILSLPGESVQEVTIETPETAKITVLSGIAGPTWTVEKQPGEPLARDRILVVVTEVSAPKPSKKQRFEGEFLKVVLGTDFNWQRNSYSGANSEIREAPAVPFACQEQAKPGVYRFCEEDCVSKETGVELFSLGDYSILLHVSEPEPMDTALGKPISANGRTAAGPRQAKSDAKISVTLNASPETEFRTVQNLLEVLKPLGVHELKQVVGEQESGIAVEIRASALAIRAV